MKTPGGAIATTVTRPQPVPPNPCAYSGFARQTTARGFKDRGFVVSNHGQGLQRPGFRGFKTRVKPFPFNVDRIAADARHFAERIYTFFRWVVTDEFLRTYGGEPCLRLRPN